jgi:RNA polymerase sigma-70 factor (family 1)
MLSLNDYICISGAPDCSMDHNSDLTSDATLLALLKAGDPPAFDALYKRYWKDIYAIAFKRLQHSQQAQDITQDIFLQLWQKRSSLLIENLPAYLATSARNKVFNLRLKEQRFTPITELLSEVRQHADLADARLIRDEFKIAYSALLKGLTPVQKEIFELKYFEDFSTDEIAEKLSLSKKTVQNQTSLALSKLRSSLGLLALLILFYKIS